ncbi:hypothetical protein AK830_g7356 [Neonectria ditissima]|uniref:Uncharacterized protein n=1 Tax=Neonectria ditissima TaxID=78410 RepID=A0A0P7BAF1_9HYPO|nr:hypothetical protein AK830_g7356 [Neonectria ditissima]
MGYHNEIHRANNDGEHRQFIRKFQAARDDIVAFVNDLMGWEGAGQYHHWLKGSFNIGYVIKRPEGDRDDNGPLSVFIRFPIPGRTYSPWSAEKVKNEVMVLKYLREHTTIPVPHVYSWGLSENSPQQLAPFIVMEFMDGVCLDDLLKKPTESNQDPLILDPDIDQNKLRVVHSQIADYMLQLSQLQFPSIGAISKDSGSWAATERPMTYDMNELVTDTGFPSHMLPSGPFNRSSDYFSQRADELWTHLYTQQNICETKDDARQRYIARRRLAELIPKHCIDDDLSFRLFSDDFGPFNMLADPKTLQITAVLDFEFTNAMPAQYLYDMPSWLLLASPHCWLERDDKASFEKLFVPQMELFIHELERAEATGPPLNQDEPSPRLSSRMRESWSSGRFWFNYAMRTSIDADVVYWKALDDGRGGEMLDAKNIEQFAETKMEQLDAYLKEKENNPRF